MTVLALLSLRGAPGTTTAALVLAAVQAETRASVLVEADPSGGVLVARVAHLNGRPGLDELAYPSRGAPPADAAWVARASQRLGDLDVVVGPYDPWRASMALSRPRQRWVERLAALPGEVVVDTGRTYPGSPAEPLLLAAEAVVVVSFPDSFGLLSARRWTEQAMLDGARRVLVLTVGEGDQGARRIAAELGDRWWGSLPWDPRAVGLLLRGASTRHRALTRSPLVRAARSRWAEMAQPAEVVA